MTTRRGILAWITSPSWRQIGRNDPGPGRLYLLPGPAPQDTVIDGITYAAVFYIDQDDQKIKARKADGTVVVIG